MRLLLLSNSTNAGELYLDYPKYEIRSFFGDLPVKALFIPYAAITFSFNDYEVKVKERFLEIGHDIISIHHFHDPIEAINNAEAIVIGGGNTFNLLHNLQKHGIINAIQQKVSDGTPFVGWSAGSNIACPTICTTNDMPIVEVNGFSALNLIPFQINPHYTDVVPANFAGETRDQRLSEFLAANQTVSVLGLREGTMLKVIENKMELIGPYSAKLFRYSQSSLDLYSGDDLNFLIN
jgi:dipeptidase E